MDEMIGIIKIFAGNFAPRGWAFCNGQLLPINQYQAVFSILGTTYGGNGVQNFALPNLQGKAPIHFGQNGGSTFQIGQVGGAENVSILTSNLPTHVHSNNITVTNVNATSHAPIAGGSFAAPVDVNGDLVKGFANSTPNTVLNSGTTGTTGNNIPLSIMQPYLAVNYIICLEGIFPSRN